MIQRALDIMLSAVALVVLSPLLLPIIIVLRLTGEGEVFFVQQRVGKGGRMFGLYKFATMLKNSPNIGAGTVTLRDDPRVLPFGKFLRRTKINELPQLFNILIGDMSVVGPRPQTARCFSAFSLPVQAAIVRVRPGLSGIASIVFRGEEDMLGGHEDPIKFYDEVIAPYKGALEEWYVQNQGLRTYLLGIAVTMWVVLIPRSVVTWRAFRTLPKPPAELSSSLGAL